MTEHHKTQAIETIKAILHAFHKKNYTEIPDLVDRCSVSDMAPLSESIQGTLELNGFTAIDEYGIPCSFNPPYGFSQLTFSEQRDRSGFVAEYQMTSDSVLVDMVLLLKFEYTDNGLKSIFLSVGPQ